VSDPKLQIHVEKAQVFKPGAVIGDTIDKEIDPSYLGPHRRADGPPGHHAAPPRL